MRVALALAICALVLASCTSPRLDGLTVVGGNSAGPVASAYRSNLSSLIASDRLTRINPGLGNGNDIARSGKPVVQALLPLADKLNGNPAGAASTAVAQLPFTGDWRTSRQTLYLAPQKTDAGLQTFRLAGLQARRLELALVPLGSAAFGISLDCDGLITVVGYQKKKFYLSVDRGNKAPLLQIGSDVKACTATVDFPETGQTRQYRLVREELVDPSLTVFESNYETCAPPPSRSMSALQAAFWKSRWLSQTCPFSTEGIITLRDSRKAFDAKVAALLGTPLPEPFFSAGNPELPLDFSQAPHLSLIYVSYLDIKADFSGKVMTRLLRFHAARGTPIRVLANASLERGKDRALLEKLAADFPNVEVRFFAWKAPSGSNAREHFRALYRVQHVKMLATLANTPGQSRVIIGGRNIHDGFLFHEPLNLKAFPDLEQYKRTRTFSLNYYSNWSDFDLAFTGDDEVGRVAGHLASYWHGDAVTKVIRPYSVEGRPNAGAPLSGIARHFISIPYTDDKALENYYVELFDAARERIEMVNPYLDPTPAIAAAIERALKRGVTIDIVGRIDMNGDLGGKLITTVNQEFVERYRSQIRIREYKVPQVLLHAKILMIDGEFVMVSSVTSTFGRSVRILKTGWRCWTTTSMPASNRSTTTTPANHSRGFSQKFRRLASLPVNTGDPGSVLGLVLRFSEQAIEFTQVFMGQLRVVPDDKGVLGVSLRCENV